MEGNEENGANEENKGNENANTSRSNQRLGADEVKRLEFLLIN
jgi:hypothetical protein